MMDTYETVEETFRPREKKKREMRQGFIRPTDRRSGDTQILC